MRAGPWRLPILDEAAREPELVALRGRMARAAQRRDWDALAADMFWRVGFGPDYQDAKPRNLAHFWGAERSLSPFWAKFSSALATGGRFRPGGVFVAPGLDLGWPTGLDPQAWLIATRPGAALREAPHPDAPVILRLLHDLIERWPLADAAGPLDPGALDWSRPVQGPLWPGRARDGWHHVRTPAGTTGYMHPDDLRSPLEHQAYFAKVEDRVWQLVAFVAPGAERGP